MFSVNPDILHLEQVLLGSEDKTTNDSQPTYDAGTQTPRTHGRVPLRDSRNSLFCFRHRYCVKKKQDTPGFVPG